LQVNNWQHLAKKFSAIFQLKVKKATVVIGTISIIGFSKL
jgi:hypothetical protein